MLAMITDILRDTLHEIRNTRLKVSLDEAGVDFVFNIKVMRKDI
jgi:hypothetical protein